MMTNDPVEFGSAGEIRGSIDVGSRAVFRFTGCDRLRYLNGQVTNDVSLATEESAIYACVTNHKGKMDGDVFVTAVPGGGGFQIDADPVLREALRGRLEKYIIADDVELEDVSDDWTLVHALGARDSTGLADPESRRFGRASDRFGRGVDLWCPADSPDPALGLPPIDAALAELIRIDRGIPRWGAELSPDLLPPEARLEARAIAYEKGCYIGQEVISRIRSVGRVNRTLERLVAVEPGEAIVGPGAFLYADGREVGRITSSAFHPGLERVVALGFVGRGNESPGTLLAAGSAENKLSCQVEIRKTPDP